MAPGTAGFVHLGLAAVSAVLVVSSIDLTLWHKAVALIIGLVLGTWAGLASAGRVEGRVDSAGGIVLYFEDTAPYGFLLPLGLLSVSPFAFGWWVGAVDLPAGLQLLLRLAVCAIAGAWLAHDAVVDGRLRRLAAKFGPLQVQWFYARSSVGPEAMIGRTGVVTTHCFPTGYVRIGSELWRAQSVDGARLVVGQQVIVRRLNGLVVLIDAADSTASNNT